MRVAKAVLFCLASRWLGRSKNARGSFGRVTLAEQDTLGLHFLAVRNFTNEGLASLAAAILGVVTSSVMSDQKIGREKSEGRTQLSVVTVDVFQISARAMLGKIAVEADILDHFFNETIDFEELIFKRNFFLGIVDEGLKTIASLTACFCLWRAPLRYFCERYTRSRRCL